MNKVAVLSRYKENNETFCNKLKSYGYSTIVYNKYQGENLLPNVGRESHTYIHYIINNYNNLPEEILFSQYDPLDHFRRKNYTKQRDDKHISSFVKNYLYDFVTINPKDYDLYVRKRKINWVKYAEFLFQKSGYEFLDKMVSTSACINGVFRVSKRAILRHDISFYQRALSMLDHHVNPDEGFFFERIWRLIFTDYGRLTNDINKLKNCTFLFGNHINNKESKVRKDGAYGHIKVYYDGTISSNGLSFYQNKNEAFWTTSQEDNQIFMYIFNVMSGITSKFNITDINNGSIFYGDYYNYNKKLISKDFFWLKPLMWSN